MFECMLQAFLVEVQLAEERVLETQIREQLQRHDLIVDVQSGFRPAHSCATSLLGIVDDVLCGADRGDLTALVLLDYTKYVRCFEEARVLPSISALKIHINKYRTVPGYNKPLFQRLKVKISTMETHEKKCALLFDEMDIKQNLELCKSSGSVIGFENMGEFRFKEIPANKVLVLMIISLHIGIYCNWKVPIAYYFTRNGVKADILSEIIEKNLIYLGNFGLRRLAIVCDQSSVNQKLYRSFKVTPENPHFYIDDVKYYANNDAPHLRYIKQLYTIDKQSETARAMPKITDLHIYPNNFQKMSVRLAAQIFSHTVAAAMLTAVGTEQLPNEALATSNLIKIMDSTFDALNSRYPFSSKTANRPLMDSNPHVLESLDKGINTMSQLKQILIKVYSDDKCYQNVAQLPYLLTGRLNQDSLENTFSTYRQHGGYNKNPIARTFNSLFKSNSVSGLLKPPNDSNCEPDEDIDLFAQSAPTMLVPEESDVESLSVSSSASDDTILEDCSVTYFAGYLAKKLLETFECHYCRKNFIGEKMLNDKQQLLLLNKNYDINDKFHLRVLTKKLIKITKYVMTVIDKYWMKYSNKYLIVIFQKHLLTLQLSRSILSLEYSRGLQW
nr:unnamed protein product [Callosobruchus analis]